MTQSLILIGFFLLILMCLPYAVSRIKQRYGLGPMGAQGQSRLVSAIAVGPNQRVVTVEVGPEAQRTWLVLGVTAQSVTCLHTLTPPDLPAANTLQASIAAAAQEPRP